MTAAILDRLTRHLPTSWSSWESRITSVSACYKKSSTLLERASKMPDTQLSETNLLLFYPNSCSTIEVE